jgi:hypothetical protein
MSTTSRCWWWYLCNAILRIGSFCISQGIKAPVMRKRITILSCNDGGWKGKNRSLGNIVCLKYENGALHCLWKTSERARLYYTHIHLLEPTKIVKTAISNSKTFWRLAFLTNNNRLRAFRSLSDKRFFSYDIFVKNKMPKKNVGAPTFLQKTINRMFPCLFLTRVRLFFWHFCENLTP